ncbi:MAG TPA: Crp/Fnr family transcriptional regulator [Thermoanaerobaculia bacterium]|nr:Crp/Fnr family transcriptional regulator [Thermoanaerobaculia bacterium]
MAAPSELYERLFQGFAPGEAERVLAGGAPRVLRRGEVLFREGEPATALYLVESGRIKLTQLTADGQEVIMRYLAPGDAFAAVALFDRSTYPVAAQATERTRVRAWPREVLPGLVRDHPRFEANLLRIVSTHTREALSRLRELATEAVAQRLARTLLRLGQQIGRGEPGGPILVERISQQDLAEIAGTSVYTVSRTLADWQERNIVEPGRQRLLIRDPEALAGIAEGNGAIPDLHRA